MADTSVSLELAVTRLVRGLTTEHLDAASRAAARSLIKDQLAIQIGAARLPWSRQVRAARALRPGASTIVGEDGRFAAADATYLNATYGHGFEYDDFAGNAHPGCHLARLLARVPMACRWSVDWRRRRTSRGQLDSRRRVSVTALIRSPARELHRAWRGRYHARRTIVRRMRTARVARGT